MARYIANVAIAIKGDRIEPGTEVELTHEEAARYDAADLTLAGASAAGVEEAADATPVSEMNLQQLKAHAKEIGLSTSGSKADLLERIDLHVSASSAANGDQPED